MLPNAVSAFLEKEKNMIEYKTVPGPVGLTISGKEDYSVAVKQYAAIIDKEAVGGWKFEIIRKVPVTKKAGCMASLLGHKATMVYVNMLVFSRDDAEAGSRENESTADVSSTALPPEVEDVAEEKVIDRVQSAAPEMPTAVTKRIDKKKMAIIAAAVVLLLILIICIAGGNGEPDDGYYASKSIDAETKEFCAMMEGIWVIPDSIYVLGDYETSVCFDYLEFSNGHLCFATYIGECYSNKQIIGASEYAEDTYDVTLYEPAIPEDHLNGPREESWIHCTIYTINGYLEIFSEDSASLVGLYYVGSDLDEAVETIEDYYAYYDYSYGA